MAETIEQITARLEAENPEMTALEITVNEDGTQTERERRYTAAQRRAHIADVATAEHARQVRQDAMDAERAELAAILDDLNAGRPLTPARALTLQRITAQRALAAAGGAV